MPISISECSFRSRYDVDLVPIVSSGEWEGWNLIVLLYYAPWTTNEYGNISHVAQIAALNGPFITDCLKTQSDQHRVGSELKSKELGSEIYSVCTVDCNLLWAIACKVRLSEIYDSMKILWV